MEKQPFRYHATALLGLSVLVPALGAEPVLSHRERSGYLHESVANRLSLSDRSLPMASIHVDPQADPLVLDSVREFADRVKRRHSLELPVSVGFTDSLKDRRLHILVAHKSSARILGSLENDFESSDLPEQGFVLQALGNSRSGQLVCYGADPLGARYGLNEIMRRLQSDGKGVYLSLSVIRKAPRFPFREVYINLSAHQMNNYSPAVITGDPAFDWDVETWRRFVDMISFFRYNWLELWLPPHLFRPEALQSGPPFDRFTSIINAMVSYAHTRGVQVDMLAPVNCTVGSGRLFNEIPFWKKHNMPAYRYLCPRVKEEHDLTLQIWRHWIQALPDVDAWSLFPGDPGGCLDNGCDATSAVDLYIDISRLVEDHNPRSRTIAHIWQWFGWGRTFLTPDREEIERGLPQVQRIDRGNDYLLANIQKFPADTQFVLNSEDYSFRTPLAPGRAEKYIRELSRQHRVTTWTYFVTEGEGWINHAYRVPEILTARRDETRLPLSGGITYTMTPELNLLNLYAGAAAYWDPDLSEEQILEEFVEGIFGSRNLFLKTIFPSFQVAPTVGYTFQQGPDWSPDYSHLRQVMEENMSQLNSVRLAQESRFPTVVPVESYLDELKYFAGLYARLALVGEQVEEARALLHSLDSLRSRPRTELDLSDLRKVLDDPSSGAAPQRGRLEEIDQALRDPDVVALPERYRNKHYSVYFAHPNEFTPLIPNLVHGFFRAFGYDFLASSSPETTVE